MTTVRMCGQMPIARTATSPLIHATAEFVPGHDKPSVCAPRYIPAALHTFHATRYLHLSTATRKYDLTRGHPAAGARKPIGISLNRPIIRSL